MSEKNLVGALAAVQSALPVIAKTNQVNAGSMKYSYADLTQVTEAVMPLLAKNGLVFIAMPTYTENGAVALHYKLAHESGESVEGWYPLPSGVRPQEFGSAITYARRYALCAVTGVAPGGDDDDAQSVEKAGAKVVKAKPKPMPDFFDDRIAGAESLEVLRDLYKEAAEGGFLPAVQQMIDLARVRLGGK